MKVSTRGLAEIASHEGIVTSRYKDSVGVWTLGIGHTASAGSPDPETNKREYTIPEIMGIFARDIAKFETRVRKAFTRELSQAQFDAAVSFDFNTGGIHRASWVDHFNAGRDAQAKKAFMNWSKPREIIPRRKAERDLFFTGKYGDGSANIYPATPSGKVMWRSGKRVDVFSLLASVKTAPSKPTEKPVIENKPTSTPPAPEKPKTGLVAAFLALLASILKGR
jgi:lysozyme